MRAARRGVWVCWALLAAQPPAGAFQKPQPSVVLSWTGVPEAPVRMHTTVRLTLHARAGSDEPDVTITLVPGSGVELVATDRQRHISLARNAEIDIPVSVRCAADGRWSLGATAAISVAGEAEVGGAVLWVVAGRGSCRFTHDPPPAF
jgi:hypothetical protein